MGWITVGNSLTMEWKVVDTKVGRRIDSLIPLTKVLITGEKKLEQLSRTRVFTGFDIPALFSAAMQRGRKGGNVESRKNRVKVFFKVGNNNEREW